MPQSRWVLIVGIGLMFAGGALGQTRDENVALCNTSRTPELALRGCTALIDSGQETPANRAVFYFARGERYRDRGEYDRAIRDFDQAIKLKPDIPGVQPRRSLSRNSSV